MKISELVVGEFYIIKPTTKKQVIVKKDQVIVKKYQVTLIVIKNKN